MKFNRRIQCTLLYAYAYFWFGALVAAAGPSLLSFSRQTNTLLEDMSMLFNSRSIASLVAALFAGFINRHVDTHRYIAMLITLATISTFIVPVASTFSVLCVCFIWHGTMGGSLQAQVNTLIFILHDKESVKFYLQLLHLSFGIGAFSSPFLVGVCLGVSEGRVDVAWYTLAALGIPVASGFLYLPSPADKIGKLVQYYSTNLDTPYSFDHSLEMAAIQLDADSMSKPQSQSSIELVSEAASDSREEEIIIMPILSRPRRDLTLIFLVVFYMFALIVVEIALLAFLPAFAIAAPGIRYSEEDAAFLMGCVWGSFTIGRLSAVAMLVKLSVSTVLIGHQLMCAISLAILLFAAQTSQTALWLGTLAFSFALSPLFSFIYTLSNTYLGHLSAEFGSLMTASGSIGEIVGVQITMRLFILTINGLWWTCLGGLAGTIGAFGAIYFCFSPLIVDQKGDHANLKDEIEITTIPVLDKYGRV